MICVVQSITGKRHILQKFYGAIKTGQRLIKFYAFLKDQG